MDEFNPPQNLTSSTSPGAEPQPARGGRFRRNVVAVGAAAGLTLGGLGIAAAQTSGDPTTTTAAPAQASPVPADPARPPGPDRGKPGPVVAAAAKAIGISEADLLTALRSGQSIAQVAQSKNVDVKVVVDAMVAEAKTRLAEEVKAGRLTQAQADERTANLQQRITDLVNRTGGGPGRGPGGRRP